MNRTSFWLVWAVGLVPVAIALVMYFFGLMLPAERKHGGELLQGHHLSQWDIQNSSELLQRDWKLVLTKPETCLTACDEIWTVLGQVHKALGKDKTRVALIRVHQTSEGYFSTKLPQLGAAIWIADPLGNLVLRYSLQDPPKQMLRDLRKLLKVSRIG